MSDTEGPDADSDANSDADSGPDTEPSEQSEANSDPVADEMTEDVEAEAVAEDEMPDPTVQSEALRRQQLFVGSGVAAIAGIAVTVATLQQLPDVPFTAALAGGLITSALLFALLFAGIFRGSDD
ncbi:MULTISPECIES: hypothetical protein [Salinibaculum]|uniref:hypothetical protein n=1 Tax=Salinibaculum TaxID=2732368 RepID=UPI0030CCF90B